MTRPVATTYACALALTIVAVVVQIRGNPVGAIVLAINGVTLAILAVVQALTSKQRP